MRSKFSIITVLFIALFWQQIACAATQMQASVSDNAIFLGDRFTLTVTIDDSGSEFQLETKSLEKDFKVSSPSRRGSKNYINGKWSAQTLWQIPLQAKKIGELVIPALQVAGLSSEPIKISVSAPSTQATKSQDNKIFIENSLDKNSVYLEQPLIFTTKIYIAQNQNTNDLQLQSPDLTGATVGAYGEDKSGETIRNGIRYKVITRQYEINASKAGTFTIASPLLTGNVWPSRSTYQPINIRGDSLQISVKSKPENYQGEWLVSEDVQLFEDPSVAKKSYQIGEPITRTITLQVASIDTDKMPSIDFNYPKSLRFYPDQDELTQGQANNLHYAQRSIRHAIIADQPGELTLPEIKLAWWNSRTDKQEIAILPALTLSILPADEQAVTSEQTNVTAKESDNKKSTSPTPVDNTNLIIWQVISALLLLALIAMALYHRSYRRSLKAHNDQREENLAQVSNDYLKLLEILNENQAAQSYQALLHYAQSEFPQLKSLSQLVKKVSLAELDKTDLTSEIKALELACANPQENWNSAALKQLITKHQHQKEKNKSHNIMELNPKK